MSINYTANSNPFNIVPGNSFPTINAQRAPTATDNFYPVNTEWVDTTTGRIYKFVRNNIVSNVAEAVWDPIAGPTPSGDYPTTPYVVGIAGQAGYQTIQSAIDAANTAGGGIVVVQPGDYTEDLTLYSGCHVTGLTFADAGGGVNITGKHTPPSSGGFVFNNVRLISATHIFDSNVAGSAHLVMANAEIFVTNGYTFNLPNWTGKLESFDVNAAVGTNDGYVNNVGGAEVDLFEVSVGSGSVNPMIVSGFTLGSGANLYCPVEFRTGSDAEFDYSLFENSLTFSNNSTGIITSSHISTGATPAITMSSSGNWVVSQCTIDSTNNPAIDGAGAGTLTVGSITFVNNSTIAGTLTTASATVKPFSTSGNTSTAIRGTAGFDSTHFTVSDGFVSLSGGGSAVDSFTPDTGTSPVVPSGSGVVSVRGQTTPNVSGIRVTGGTNALDIAMFSPFEGDFEFSQSSASSAAERVLYITNADTANATSHSVLSLSTAGTTSGDPFVLNSIGSRAYALGMTRASNDYILATAASGTTTPTSGTTLVKVTSAGVMTKPLQPFFNALLSANTSSDKTGDSTEYQIIFNTITDQQGSGYDATTGIFTAPGAGNYFFSASATLIDLGAGHTLGGMAIVTSSLTYWAPYQVNTADMRSSANICSLTGSGIFYLAAGETARVIVRVSNSTKTVGVEGDGTPATTWFSGALIC